MILPGLRFGRGSFGLDGGLFALEVGLAALFVFGFVVLSAHNVSLVSLLCSPVAIWCRHYEFLRATIQSLFLAGGPAAAGFRLRAFAFP